MKNEVLKLSTPIEKIKDVSDNPYLTTYEKDAFNACYFLFRYCLTSLKCGDNCPIKSVMGCKGKLTQVDNPRLWGNRI